MQGTTMDTKTVYEFDECKKQLFRRVPLPRSLPHAVRDRESPVPILLQLTSLTGMTNRINCD